MKKITVFTILTGIFLIFVLSAPAPGHAVETQVSGETAHEQAAKTIIARVGAGQITLGQVMNKIKDLTVKKYGYSEITPTLAERIKAEAIEKLINEELAYQHAMKIGIQVTPAEIQAHIEAYKKSLGGDDKFNEYLLTNNMTIKDYGALAERFLAVRKSLAQEVDAKVKEVTEEDIIHGYNEAKEQFFVQQERLVIADITFFLDPEEKESLEKVTAVRNQLVQDLSGDISKLPADPSFVIRDNLTLSEAIDPGLHKAAVKLQKDEVSAPIISKGTYHLVKLLSYTPRVEKPLTEVRPYLKKKIQEKFRQDRLDEWRLNIRKDADVEILETKKE